MHKVPYTVTKPCGGWLLWKICTVTLYRMTYQTEYKTVMKQVTRCCEGYVQVGHYCALPVNRSGEFTAKPGSCPNADGLYPRSEDCDWDIDCPGWQKCCQRSGSFVCSDPASSANYSENGGYRFNATVTVKTDHHQLMSKERGLLNHTRLLQAMVTGALQSDLSVYYLSSWPVHPYRTATSLLIVCNSTLSLYNVTSRLHLLLKHMQEVSSVTVEDVDECAHSSLCQCSLQAECNNTVGSYQCTCRGGYVDVDPSNPGAHCTADITVWTTTEAPLTSLPPMNMTLTPASNTTHDPTGNSTMGIFNSTETNMTTSALSNTSSVSYNSSHAPHWTSPAPYTSMSSTVESPLPTTTCSPPSISSLELANVTGTSFCVTWSSEFQTNQTYRVVLTQRSEVNMWETSHTMMEVRGLLPGVLYNVTVTPCVCGSQGNTLHILVRTDAQTLDATARLTKIQFTADLQTTSSQAYKNLSESFIEEIYQSLSPEMKAMVDSGQVRIEIRSFSPGSVVVNFSIILTPNQGQDIRNVSTALLYSLMNSSKYSVDENNTSINDYDECASGGNDCSQWATCTNTWASYMCVCKDGFIDSNSQRPGRACQATLETTTPPLPPTTLFSVSTTTFSQITLSSSDPTLTTTTTAVRSTTLISTTSTTTQTVATTGVPVVTTAPTTTSSTPTIPSTTSTPPITTSTAPITTSTAPTTTSTAPTTTSTAPATTSTTPTTTFTAPTTTSTAPTTTSAVPTTTSTALAATSTTPTTTSTAPATTFTAPAVTSTAPIPTSTAPATTSTAPTTTSTALVATSTAPTTTSTAPAVTSTAPITISTAPATTSTAPSVSSTAPTITSTTPTTTSTTPTTTSTAPTTTSTTSTTTNPSTPYMTSTPTTTITNPTTTTTASTTNAPAIRTAINASIGAISVQCRVASITVTVAKDFLLSSKIRESALYLGQQECGVNSSNATHAQLTVAWDECVTRLVHNDTYYTASVTLFNTMDPYILPSGTVEVPRIRLEVPVMCTYMRSMLMSADFGSMGYDMIKDVITGSGSFQVTVQLMNGTVPLPHNYSLSSEEAVVVEVSLNTSSQKIKVVINMCWATPTPNSADTNRYIFLDNRCSLNQYTKVLMNGNSSTSRVSVQIFSFVNLNMIYLHCQVQICVQIGSATCVPDCVQRTSRSSNTIGAAVGSTGPILRFENESLEEEHNTLQLVGLSCLGVGLSLFFIIGFICLFYYQRNRIGHYNFSVKPKQENFTYLVFNT
ncbi:uromodulin-like 1 [Thunnus thynnus]|uniref:uromodulin-like 1 n=1 Tax=Thunnus thynnus TaxID=8237 RepID=UPI0035287E1C